MARIRRRCRATSDGVEACLSLFSLPRPLKAVKPLLTGTQMKDEK